MDSANDPFVSTHIMSINLELLMVYIHQPRNYTHPGA